MDATVYSRKIEKKVLKVEKYEEKNGLYVSINKIT